MIGPDSLPALGAFTERVRKTVQMSTSLPDFGGQENPGVQTDAVPGSASDKELPPFVADVHFQLSAERTIVKAARETPVQFGTGEDEATALTEGNDGAEGRGRCGRFGLRHGLEIYEENKLEVLHMNSSECL